VIGVDDTSVSWVNPATRHRAESNTHRGSCPREHAAPAHQSPLAQAKSPHKFRIRKNVVLVSTIQTCDNNVHEAYNTTLWCSAFQNPGNLGGILDMISRRHTVSELTSDCLRCLCEIIIQKERHEHHGGRQGEGAMSRAGILLVNGIWGAIRCRSR